MSTKNPQSKDDTVSRLVVEVLCIGIFISLLVNQISDQIHLPLVVSIPLLVLCFVIILLISTNRVRSAFVLLFVGMVAAGGGVLIYFHHASSTTAIHGGSSSPSPGQLGSGMRPTSTPSKTGGSGPVPTTQPATPISSPTAGAPSGIKPHIAIHYTHGQVTQANGVVTTTASCSPGEVLVGGGANVAGTLYSDYPSSQSAWTAEGSGSYTGQAVDAWAICASGANAMSTIIKTSGSVPIANGGDARVSCPSGSLMVGGGHRITPAPAMLFGSGGAFTVRVAGSTPMAGGANGWDVFAYGDTNEQLTTYALCAQHGPTSSTIVTSTATVPPQRGADIVATCAQGQLLTSGGGADVTETSSQSMALEGSLPASSGWDYRAYNYEDATNSHQGQVYLVCVSF